MALGNRYKSAPGAGTLAALILVLVFGSPWYADWATKNTNPNTAGGWWLRLLAWPHWEFNSNDSLREIVVGDLRAILLVVLTALFLYLLPGSQLARARGTISQFFAGWARVRLRRRLRRAAHHAVPDRTRRCWARSSRPAAAPPTACSSAGSSAWPPSAAAEAPLDGGARIRPLTGPGR